MLESIRSPQDVKKLSEAELAPLCREIRQFLVQSVSRTGGHLASNLGAVELTVAIHRVFDTERDRLVFDVGHQCYVHKILTGRAEAFSALRQFGGLSGFPKPHESVHDAFVAGHASNSVSVALGMARARTLRQENYSVLALIGDGALSGGLAYEGLNDAGASGEPLIVILNDNGMSISRNVGAVARHLSVLRTKPEYYAFKKAYRALLGGNRAGRALYRFNHKIKTKLKKSIFPNATLFEDMGFAYLGPVDGHDLEQLTSALRWARDLRQPVLVHVHTVKGKGYPPAEEQPSLYHGVSPFDPAVGVVPSESVNFSTVFGRTMEELAAQDARVCAITAAMEDGTGLFDFAKRYPDRFFDVGIAEGHASAMAGGMAAGGMIPVFAVYSTFLQRAYDQIIHDSALGGLHTVFAVDRTGLVGADGETHHGVFDVAYLTEIPGMTVLCPANYAELHTALRRAVLELTGPVAVRYPRGKEGHYREDSGTACAVVLRPGSALTLCAYGTMTENVLNAAELLASQGVEARVVKLNQIAPLPEKELCEALGDSRLLLIAEECLDRGCVGEQIAAMLSRKGSACRVKCRNLGMRFAPQGSTDALQKEFGLDAESLAAAAMEVLHE